MQELVAVSIPVPVVISILVRANYLKHAIQTVLLGKENACTFQAAFCPQHAPNRGITVADVRAGWLVVTFILEARGTQQDRILLRSRVSAQRNKARVPDVAAIVIIVINETE